MPQRGRSRLERSPGGGAALAWALPALLLVACGSGEAPSPEAGPANVLFVTLDTTRPDHLGCYGYARDTSPNLDALCADAVVHTRAYSTSSWTLPAHASLFTGRFPSSHGARYDPEGPLILGDAIRGRWARDFRARGLAEADATLAEVLRDAGYATGGVVAGPWMKRIFGLSRGFDHWDDEDIAHYRGRLAQDVTARALAWVGARAGEPFFLFLNYYDPHAPYHPPPDLLALFHPLDQLAGEGETPTREESVARYDAEIRYMDLHFGRLLDGLRGLGLYDAMWVVVTSDHGELFGEHGLHRHGSSLYEGEIRVPLVVKPPGGGGGRRSAAPIQLTDLAPLLLEGLGLPLPDGMPRRGEGDDAVLTEVHPLPGNPRHGDWYALQTGGYKLLRGDGESRELFHLAEDPDETRNLLEAEPARAARLAARLDGLLASLPQRPRDGPPRAVDPETRRALESLGYLEADGEPAAGRTE